MRNLRIIHILFGLPIFISAPYLKAQTGDWQAVENIPLGTKITVAVKHHLTIGHCFLSEVSDEGLSCEGDGPRWLPLPAIHYRRRDIRAVYLGRHTVETAVLIGAGVGVIWGIARPALSGPGGRPVSAILDGAVFAGVGWFVGSILDLFIRGRLVYRCPKDPSQGRHKGDGRHCRDAPCGP